MPTRTLGLLSMTAAIAVSVIAVHAQVKAEITVTPTTRYQTFRGWEVIVLPTVLDYAADGPALGRTFELAASDLGITRIKVGMFSGTEGPSGRSAAYLAGTMPEREFLRRHAYDIINDNKDPGRVNPEGFDFGILDWQMTNMVVPFTAALEKAGETPTFVLGYVDNGVSSFEHHDHPEEYAELMSATFAHLKSAYGRVPDQIDVMNEPDMTKGRWTGQAMGKVVAATGRRLDEEGYQVGFIGPSTMDRARALPFLADMLETRAVDRYLTQISYHCYADTGTNTHARIGQVVSRTRLESAQDECWAESNNPAALMADLKLARVSAWQQATFRGPNGYYLLNPSNGTAALRPKTRLLRQFYRYIRPGAVRIDAATSDPAMDPVAFVDPDGRSVVVLVATSAGAVVVTGLPDGAYDVSYSTASAFDVHVSTAVAGGSPLSASIPDAGVMTIRAERASSQTP